MFIYLHMRCVITNAAIYESKRNLPLSSLFWWMGGDEKTLPSKHVSVSVRVYNVLAFFCQRKWRTDKVRVQKNVEWSDRCKISCFLISDEGKKD